MALNVNIHCDSRISPSQMVFGENIRFPGVYFDESLQTFTSEHVNKLINVMRDLTLLKPRSYKNNKEQLLTRLETCTHVFIRIDAKRVLLQAIYKRPYFVVHRYDTDQNQQNCYQ